MPFPYSAVLAPMEGVGHPIFRKLTAALGGLDLVCTEFVRISRAPLSPAALAKAVVKVPGLPLSVQVMGNDADKMADAAVHVARAGADIVDINLGCPMPRVVRKGVGAAMLKDPSLLASVLGEMRTALDRLGLKTQLSAKIRAGFDTADHVVSIAKVVQDAGVDFITVHPRRRVDLYQGVSDWRIIRLLVDELSIPVIGNGDIWYASDAIRMSAETGCAGVMLGRPAMRNPWIFAQIESLRENKPPFEPQGADVANWLHQMQVHYGREFVGRRAKNHLGKLKEIVSWIGRAVRDEGAFRQRALRSQDLSGFLTQVDSLASLTAEELDLSVISQSPLERSGSASGQSCS